MDLDLKFLECISIEYGAKLGWIDKKKCNNKIEQSGNEEIELLSFKKMIGKFKYTVVGVSRVETSDTVTSHETDETRKRRNDTIQYETKRKTETI